MAKKSLNNTLASLKFYSHANSNSLLPKFLVTFHIQIFKNKIFSLLHIIQSSVCFKFSFVFFYCHSNVELTYWVPNILLQKPPLPNKFISVDGSEHRVVCCIVSVNNVKYSDEIYSIEMMYTILCGEFFFSFLFFGKMYPNVAYKFNLFPFFFSRIETTSNIKRMNKVILHFIPNKTIKIKPRHSKEGRKYFMDYKIVVCVADHSHILT